MAIMPSRLPAVAAALKSRSILRMAVSASLAGMDAQAATKTAATSANCFIGVESHHARARRNRSADPSGRLPRQQQPDRAQLDGGRSRAALRRGHDRAEL